MNGKLRGVSTPTFLIILVAGVLLPVLLFAAGALTHFGSRERERLGESTIELARRVTAAVDRELIGLQRTLQVLSISRSLARQDYAEFYQQAMRVKELVGADIIYKEPTGQQLVNTRVPFGAKLPISMPEPDRQALASEKLFISGLFKGATAQRLIVSLYVPVRHDNKLAGLLILAQFPEHFARLLGEQGIPDAWTGAIVDRDGRIIARSREHNRFSGSMATADLLENAVGQEGTWIGRTIEGTAVRAAYVRSSLSGWRVAVGVPETVLEAPLQEYFRWLGGFGAAALLLGLTLALLTGRQLSRAMSSLARAASEIGTTATLATPSSHVREVQAIGAAMSQASARLHTINDTLEQQVRERTCELESANAKLKQEMVDRNRAEQQLRQLQKMEAIGQLTGGMAHDFNNILAVIGGSLELAQKRFDRGEPGAVPRYLGAAQEGVKRATELTQRMLAFSRQQPLSPAALDMNRVVSNMARLLQRTLGEQISIETVLAAGLWAAHVDANQLENALLNIAVNGRDAMPNGGKLTIETANVYLDEEYAARNAGLSPGQYVLVAVTDTGTGMSPEIVAKAFDPFFTTKPVGAGTGMGLSQVYGFVRQSGGHVKIYSEEGKGTTLKVYLPRSNGVLEAKAEPYPQTNADHIKLPPMTVLVVEDNDEVRQFTVDALAEIGCKVLQANGSSEARRILATDETVDVLFTDIVMPGENGRVLAEGALRKRPGLKVLFTTGYSRNAIIHNGVIDPGVHLIAKPFTIAELTRKLAALLG